MKLASTAQQLLVRPWFQRATIGLILFAGALVGVETSPELMARHGALLHALDRVVLGLFVAELVVRFVAHGRRPWAFFGDAWNVFDFLIVAVCLLPFPTQFAAVLRLVRVLRVLRLVTALPRLQILVGALLKSIPSMSYVAMLLGLLFYVYAVMGVALFRAADPAHFGGLGAAALTLFQVVTLEGWAEIMRGLIGAPGVGVAAPILFFVSFILLGTMIVLNLLIGVIVSGMDEARAETADDERARHLRETGKTTPADDAAQLQRQLTELQESLAALQRRL
jgi:voltage-gated sodium channel